MTASPSLTHGLSCMPAAAMLALSWPAAAGTEPTVAAANRASGHSTVIELPADLPPGDVLADYRRYYDEALAGRQYVEAATAAKQLIGRIIESDGDQHGLMADALSRLAYAQRQQSLYEPAVANYLAAIDLLGESENRLSASLVTPLAALGETYMASGRADLALPRYQQALHVSHVNEGPHSLEQIEILDAIATALAEEGDADAALATVEQIHYLYAREFSPDSEEVLPALERKAELLNELGRHAGERAVYRDIVRIIQKRRGESDLGLLKVYSALGRTYFHDLDDVYFRSEPTTETGETFLRRALRITEENPAATWLMQEQALLELADYYTLRDVQDKARIHYRRAWQLLSSTGERLDRRRYDLEKPVRLLRPTLDPSAHFGYRSSDRDADPADYEEGYVVARFTVNERGRATDVEIADAEPRGFAAMETRVRQAVRDLVYRPRYADGEPASTRGELFRHDYRYLDSDLEGSLER